MLNWGDFWEHTRSHFVGSVTTSVIYLPIYVFKSDDLRTVLNIFFLFPYIALISAFTAQMALLGFIFPLFIPPGTCHLMVEDYSRAFQREREVRRKKKKKKAQKKTTLL